MSKRCRCALHHDMKRATCFQEFRRALRTYMVLTCARAWALAKSPYRQTVLVDLTLRENTDGPAGESPLSLTGTEWVTYIHTYTLPMYPSLVAVGRSVGRVASPSAPGLSRRSRNQSPTPCCALLRLTALRPASCGPLVAPRPASQSAISLPGISMWERTCTMSSSPGIWRHLRLRAPPHRRRTRVDISGALYNRGNRLVK